MENDYDYVTPIVGGAIALTIAYVGSKLMMRYVEKKLVILEAENAKKESLT